MKPPLLILHGALGSSAQFESWHDHLDDDFTLYLMDFEGHGIMGFSGDFFHMNNFAENILSFLNKFGISQANVFGYSMGGYAALTLAAKYPERFHKIMTLGTKFDWSPESSAKEVKMLNADKIAEKVPKFAAALEARHPGIGWRNVLAHTANMMLELGDAPNLSPEVLAGIQLPVLIGLGDQDNMVSQEESQAAAKALPNAEFRIFPETQHPIERVDGAKISAAIKEFML